MLEILGMYAAYSLPITLSKAALKYSQPLFLVAVRMFIAAPLLLGYVYFFDYSQFRFSRNHLSLLIQGIVSQVYLGYIFLFWSFQFISATKSAIFFSYTPFITAIICFFLYNEKVTIRKIMGMLIAFLGSIPLLISHSNDQNSICCFLPISLAEIATFIAVIGFAYGWIVFGKLTRDHHYSPCMINGLSMMVGAILISMTSPFIDTWNPYPFTEFWPFFYYVIALVFISNILAFNWYMALLRKHSPTNIAFFSFSEPLFVAFYSWIWLSEVITWQFYASFTAIFFGLYLFYQKK